MESGAPSKLLVSELAGVHASKKCTPLLSIKTQYWRILLQILAIADENFARTCRGNLYTTTSPTKRRTAEDDLRRLTIHIITFSSFCLPAIWTDRRSDNLNNCPKHHQGLILRQ